MHALCVSMMRMCFSLRCAQPEIVSGLVGSLMDHMASGLRTASSNGERTSEGTPLTAELALLMHRNIKQAMHRLDIPIFEAVLILTYIERCTRRPGFVLTVDNRRSVFIAAIVVALKMTADRPIWNEDGARRPGHGTRHSTGPLAG